LFGIVFMLLAVVESLTDLQLLLVIIFVIVTMYKNHSSELAHGDKIQN
jgi:hypothetical protein